MKLVSDGVAMRVMKDGMKVANLLGVWYSTSPKEGF